MIAAVIAAGLFVGVAFAGWSAARNAANTPAT